VPATVRMGCPELLFQPTKNGMTCKSIQGIAWGSVGSSDIDVRKELCKNIIMSGGSTMYEGIADRLKQELINLAPSGAEIRVVAAADRKYAVWKGGSTLASLSTFASSWVTAEDYQEHGAAVIHRKCA
jgi:actin